MSSQNKDNSFKSEELAAQRAAAIGRSIAMFAIAILITVLAPWPMPIYYYFTLSLFVLLGWLAYGLAKSSWGKSWHQYAFVSADFILLTFVILYPNPLFPIDFPAQIGLRGSAFVHFFVLLAGITYIYQPRLVLWGGVSLTFAWSTGVMILLLQPETVWRGVQNGDFSSFMIDVASPYYIDFSARLQEIVVFLIVAGLLALAVKRARVIALRQVSVAQERTNLARYFPAKTAELLANKTSILSQPREHNAAVLFADLVGFTTWSQRHSPTETIELLREVHGMLTQIIFRHHGTLDKFMGDGLMATFGTPEPTDQDASNALAAAIEISTTFEQLRRSKPVGEGRTLKLAVGVHYGPVIIGDVGTEDRLEFAVLGDTVNVASRIEQATRQVDCMCLISEDLAQAAKNENSDRFINLKANLKNLQPIALRGREGKIPVYAL